jgi:hypothetical protein
MPGELPPVTRASQKLPEPAAPELPAIAAQQPAAQEPEADSFEDAFGEGAGGE